MNELVLLYRLFVGLIELILWILKQVGRLLRWLWRGLRSLPGRAERGGSEPAWARETGAQAMRGRSAASQLQLKPAAQRPVPRRDGAAAGDGRPSEWMATMAAQRRDPTLRPLLEMADRLAVSLWEPLCRYAAGGGISIGPERCRTVLGVREGLAGGSGDVGALGVVPLFLPLNWATEPALASALVHELGHRLYGGLAGLDAELRAALGLSRAALAAERSKGTRGAGVRPLLAVWLEELWVDTVGVMMLGSAYVRGMMWAFGAEETPEKVIEYRLPGAVFQEGRQEGRQEGGQGGGGRYDEHPPAHLRVLLACYTLAQLGEASEAEACEAEWRDRHDAPEEFYFLTSMTQGVSVEEAFLREPGQTLVTALRERRWLSLGSGAGRSGGLLSSLPGLDRGPRERRAIDETVANLLLGRPAATRDARVLMAGMVRARFQEPMGISQASIWEAVGATVRMWGGQEPEKEGERAMAEEEDDPVRDALLLAALLPPPPSLRRRPWS